MDYPSFSPKQIYQTIAFSFNNENVKIQVLDGAYDLDGIDDVNAHEFSEIQVIINCKLPTMH